MRSVCFQSLAARLSSASARPEAHALLHPLRASEVFLSFRTSTQFPFDSAEDTASLAVAQVLRQLGEAVKAAVEYVAAGSAGVMLDVERHLSAQADAVAEAGMARFDQTVAEVKAHRAKQTNEQMSVVIRREQKVDALSADRAGDFSTSVSGAPMQAEHSRRVIIAAPPPAPRARVAERITS